MSDQITPAANTPVSPAPWSWYKKLGFRILFIFFLAMSIPSTSGWYTNAVTVDWFHPHYRDIYDIARFQPAFTRWFGGKGGDEGDFAGANQNQGDANANKNDHPGNRKKHHHQADSSKTGQDSAEKNDNSLAIQGNGARRHHHHDGDTTQTANNSAGHHHHRDSTLASTGDAHLAGSGHHHHHSDSTLNAGESLVVNNHGDGKKHHHRDSSSVKDTAGNDTSKIDAVATGKLNNGHDDSKRSNADAPATKRNFLADYTDWGIALLIGIVGGLIWTLLDRKSKSYHILYYWIRVVVRYRAGIGIIGFGFTKLFPTQMPYPSLGLLNSNFGDFTAQKIYWMSVGVVPWYQVFGGIVEIAAGTMLFFRKTTLLGAILLAGALGDITFVNYAYDGGVHVYAFYFVALSLFLIADDVPKLYNLLILERYTVPFRVYPDFSKPALKYTRIGLKVLTFLIFFVILTYTEVINFKYDPYKQPSTAGVKTLRGNYRVTEFKINGQDLPYNPLDTTRWQEATFENWTTLTFKVNHPVLIDPSNGGGSPMKDILRTFEITGVAGGQRAFHYYADTIDKVLYLQDKNAIGLRGGRGGKNRKSKAQPKVDNWISKTAWQHIGDEKKMIDPRAYSTRRDREFAAKTPEPKRNRMVLNYNTVNGSRVILSGINERKDSIYVVLDRYDRKYALPQSTLRAGKY